MPNVTRLRTFLFAITCAGGSALNPHTSVAQASAPPPTSNPAPAAERERPLPTPREVVNPANAATAEPSAPAAEAESIVLSPFVINAERESGYLGTQTLGGNRLSTDIRDIGSSISVYTKDLIDDLGITNLSDILVYGVGTEVGGVAGNFSGNTDTGAQITGDNSRTTPQGSARTRGLAGPNNLRNLFNTSIPGDSYNTGAVTVNRGPNAVLFGVGSPAGVIDFSLNQADLRRNSHRVEFRTDQNGSLRSTLDVNRVLIPRKVALRIAAVDDLENFNQDPAFEHRERIYGALTVKPFSRTTVRVNAEAGRSKANRPITVLPFNSIVDSWYSLPADRKVFDFRFYDYPEVNSAANTIVAGTQSIPFQLGQGQIFNQIAVIYNQPNQTTPDASFKTEVNSGNGLNQVRATIFHPVFNRDNAFDALQFYSTRNVGELQPVAFPGGTLPGFVQFESFKDFSAFDWENDMIDTSSRQLYSFRNVNIQVEQLFWDDRVGVEFAYNKEFYEARNRNSFFQAGNNNHIRIDANVFLPNGQLNPNVGRPYAQYGGGNWSDPENARENFRLTSFLRYNFADLKPSWAKWLGRHTLTGLYEEYLNETLSNNTRLSTFGDAATAVSVDPANFNRRPTLLVYLGDSILNGAPLKLNQINIPPLEPGATFDTFYFASPASTTVQGDGRIVQTRLDLIGETASYNINLIKSEAAVLQSYFLKDHLITTVGWRRDESYRTRRDIQWNPNTAPQVLYSIDDFNISRGSLPLEDADDIVSYSAVIKWPDSIIKLPWGLQASVFYNESETFTPSGGRVDVLGESLGSPKGTTEEYGINLWAMEDRLFIRANVFETGVIGQGVSATTAPYGPAYNQGVYGLAAAWLESMNTNPQINRLADIELLWSALPPGTRELWGFIPTGSLANGTISVPPANFPATRADTTDFTAEGTEVEVTFTPNRQWRFTGNVSEQETIRTNIQPAARAFIERMLPVWEQLGSRPRGAYPAGWDPARPDSELPATTERLSTFLNSASGPLPGYQALLAQEGQSAIEQRNWRANLVANYTFPNDSFLKGWNIGGTVRWQDKVLLGYASRVQNGAIIYDINQPYFGPEETNLDLLVGYRRKLWNNKVEWRTQLNVRNIVNFGDDLILVRTQYDGSGAAYRLAPERRFTLSSSFSF